MKEWKEILEDKITAELKEQIDIYETQIELKRKGKVDDKIFAETRLRKGVYGQRYDNGQRHDGNQTQELSDQCLTKNCLQILYFLMKNKDITDIKIMLLVRLKLQYKNLKYKNQTQKNKMNICSKYLCNDL